MYTSVTNVSATTSTIVMVLFAAIATSFLYSYPSQVGLSRSLLSKCKQTPNYMLKRSRRVLAGRSQTWAKGRCFSLHMRYRLLPASYLLSLINLNRSIFESRDVSCSDTQLIYPEQVRR